MKILLINSSFGKRYDSRKTVTLAMYYLGAILRDKGHTIHIINPDDYIDGMVGESLASVIIEKFKDFDLFAFSSNTFTWGYVKKCISTLKVNNIKNPIVFGGIHPSRVFNHIMQTTDIDYILIGEGDKSFPILVETLERKKNLSEVPNLVYRNDKGDIMINSFMDKMTFDKNTLYSAYDLIPENIYETISIETSRGCSGNCSFCSILNKRCWRGFNSDEAVKRIIGIEKYMRDKILRKSIIFTDDHFFEDKVRAIEILTKLSVTNIKSYSFLVEAKLKVLLDDNVLSAIKKFPGISVQVGVESGYDEGLKRIKKGIKKEQIFQVAEKILKYQLNTNIFFSFIIGFPWETKKDIFKTIETVGFIAMKYNIIVNLVWWLPLPSPEFDALRKMNPDIGFDIFDNVEWNYDERIFEMSHPLLTQKDIIEINEIIAAYAEVGYDLIIREKK